MHHRNFFIPVERILGQVEDFGAISIDDLDEYKPDRRASYLTFVRLLEGMDLLERHNGSWRSTIAMKTALGPHTDFDDRVKKVIGLLIGKRYKAMKDVLKITALEAPIRLQNVVYLPEVEVGHPLLRKRDTLRAEYYYHYSTKLARMDMSSILRTLVRVKAVESDTPRGTFSGNDDLLEKMIEQKAELTPIASLHESRA